MSNKLFIEIPKNAVYKVYIGKGNNYQLVK